ncbi:catalase [Sorangium sp. So ce296]
MRRRSGAGEVPAPPDRRMALDSNPTNDFAEVEQAAFGTGVLVDGMDLLDDKLLQGRTFSYADTQRYRVGPDYLQLPLDQPRVKASTNQRDGQRRRRALFEDRRIQQGLGPTPTPQREDRRPPREGELDGRDRDAHTVTTCAVSCRRTSRSRRAPKAPPAPCAGLEASAAGALPRARRTAAERTEVPPERS